MRSTIPVTNWYDGDDDDRDHYNDGNGDVELLVLEGGYDRGTEDSPSQPTAFQSKHEEREAW